MPAATPQRLTLLPLGYTRIPLPAGGNLDMVLGCYLVQLSDGRHVLIDSGLPADYTSPPGTPPSEGASNVIAQLDQLGLAPEDIDLLICTHFDIDHAGYNDRFTQAEHIVQRTHDALARGGHPRFAAARPHWNHPATRYRLVEGDTELLPGLRLIATSGHAPGHQSVLIDLPRTGRILLTIDAVSFESLFYPGAPGWAAR